MGVAVKLRSLGARYAAEFLVVFLGVWLSLVAEDWREGRAAADTEASSLRRMAEDLDSDLADLRVNLARAEVGVVAGKWLLDRGQDTAAPADSLVRALSAVLFCSVFVETPAEYLALRNSGQLGVIRDPDLRRRIVALYETRLHLRYNHTSDCNNNDAFFGVLIPFVTMAPPEQVVGVGAGPDGLPDSTRPRVIRLVDRRGLLRDRVAMNRLTNLVSHRAFLTSRIQASIDDVEHLRGDLLGRAP